MQGTVLGSVAATKTRISTRIFLSSVAGVLRALEVQLQVRQVPPADGRAPPGSPFPSRSRQKGRNHPKETAKRAPLKRQKRFSPRALLVKHQRPKSRQKGFSPGHSTIQYFLYLKSLIRRAVMSEEEVDQLFFDAKASARLLAKSEGYLK